MASYGLFCEPRSVIIGMMNRTFHKRFTLPAKCGVGVFFLLAAYLFWVKVAILGILVAIVIVGMIERILNTTYSLQRVKPIDCEEEMDFLIVNEGRFSRNKTVPVCDIVRIEQVKTAMGMDHCVVIEYGAKRLICVQPDNEEAFIKEIKKRQEND